MVFDAETVELPDGKEETKVSIYLLRNISKGAEESRIYINCLKFGLDCSKLVLIFYQNFD